MKQPSYKTGDLLQYNRTEVDELIMILKYGGIANISSDANFKLSKVHYYSCYNVTSGFFMDKTEKFLDLYYNKVS